MSEPRVFRSGDSEPGEGVQAVLDRYGDLWFRSGDGWESVDNWRQWPGQVSRYGPLVEVTLPEPVAE